MKTAIFLAEGFEEIEAVNIIDVLRRGKASVDVFSMTDKMIVEGSHGISIEADLLFKAGVWEDYDMLLLPGGMPGTSNLRKHNGLCSLLKAHHAKGKAIGAICAAPSILGDLGILEGKEATVYPGYEEHMKGCKVSEQPIVVSHNITTGKGAGVAIHFALEIIRNWQGDAFATKLGQALMILR